MPGAPKDKVSRSSGTKIGAWRPDGTNVAPLRVVLVRIALLRREVKLKYAGLTSIRKGVVLSRIAAAMEELDREEDDGLKLQWRKVT